MLHDAVDRFYGRLLHDPELKNFFTGTNILLLKWHQFNFMSIAFAKVPAELDVQKLVLDKHKRLFDMGLDVLHFDIMMDHLKKTFLELNVDQDLIDHAESVLAPMRGVFEQGASRARQRRVRSLIVNRIELLALAAVAGFIVIRYLRKP